MPRVSIGLPVYNGERYISQAIDSLLRQTYTDFELVISDNASTDSTRDICLEYTTQDDRIRYHHNDRNIGAAKNFNRAFQLSTGEYFKWMAADNALKPEFLQRCVEILDSKESAILVCTRYIAYNEFNDTISTSTLDISLPQRRPHHRFKKLMSNPGVSAIWGLMRSNELRSTHLIRSFIGSDLLFIAELAVRGKFIQIPDYLAFVRRHPKSYTDLKKKNAGVEGEREAKWLNPDNKTPKLPHWRRLAELFLLVTSANVPVWEKGMMGWSLVYPAAYNWSRILLKELLFYTGLRRTYAWIKQVKG